MLLLLYLQCVHKNKSHQENCLQIFNSASHKHLVKMNTFLLQFLFYFILLFEIIMEAVVIVSLKKKLLIFYGSKSNIQIIQQDTYPAILFLSFLLGIMAISSHTRLLVWKSNVRRV